MQLTVAIRFIICGYVIVDVPMVNLVKPPGSTRTVSGPSWESTVGLISQVK